jgi:hypothetical protein
MEESADALAGVEGALTGDKPAAAAATSPKKKAKTEKTTAPATTESEDTVVPDPMAATTSTATASKKKGAKAKDKEPAEAKDTAAADTGTVEIPAATATKETTASKSSESKKAQISYNPDVNMTKEQLTAWRREMRRVRNRESAAASRRKVRDRIEELEEEVDVWKKRYAEVMAKLGEEAKV